MPDNIDLASLGFGVDDHRRDQWGRMLIVPPGGGDPLGYSRVTTIAKALDDGGGLGPWKASLAIVGMLGRPGLRDRWQALIAGTSGDPWYFSAASKAECKRLVEQCAEAGGSTNRAEQGTSLHALTALVDVGANVTGLLPETERDVNAYVSRLIDEGITIMTNPSSGLPCVEVTTVLDEYRVAGTADRIVHVPGFERPLIADLKTGTDLGYSWNSIAVQLAAYAHGDAEYAQGPDPNGSTDIRGPMPDVDREHGLIIHLPAGEGGCLLYIVDLAAGWDAFHTSLAARAWRGRRDLAMTLPKPPARVKITLESSATLPRPALTIVPPPQTASTSDALVVEMGATWEQVELPFEHELDATRNVGVIGAPGAGSTTTVDLLAALDAARASHPAARVQAVQAPQSDEHVVELVAWLQQRVDVCGTFSDAARADLMRSWPAGVAPLKAGNHSADELARIEVTVDDVEARHSIPFGPTRPDHSPSPERWTDRLATTFPNTTITPKEQP